MTFGVPFDFTGLEQASEFLQRTLLAQRQ